MMLCPICGAQQREYFRHVLLTKYTVTYFFCDTCGFLRTEQPYWLDEAYSDAIAVTDTGLVSRNVASAATAVTLFGWMFGGRGRYIDLAGGYGMFTRLMRDAGFDYYWSDRYAQNVFARGFEAALGGEQEYRAATAFEVLEHLERPLDFVRDAFASTRCEALFFSTELYPGAEPPASWWYYGLNTGQHIGFFHGRTLEAMARVLGLHLNSSGSFHLLSRAPMGSLAFRLLTARPTAKLFALIAPKIFRSKVEADHLHLVAVGSPQRK